MKRRLLAIALVLVLVLTNISVQPVSAQQGIVWNTQFFNNPYLSSPTIFSRQDSTVSFNWGTGSPAPGVNADNFTARFSGGVYFPAGTYRFYVLADDGIHLWVDDNNLLIDTFDQPRPGQTLTADITLSAGTHAVQLDYREVTGDAYVYLSWANLTTNPTGPNFTAPAAQPPPVTRTSWLAEYFSNASLSGSPAMVLSEVGPSHNWGHGAPVAGVPVDNFSVRWTNTQLLDGTYQISVRADDGIRVLIDGTTYINEWHSGSGLTYTTNFTVSRGMHTVVIEYFEGGGLAFLEYGLTQISSGSAQQPAPPPAPVSIISWTAQYFGNTTLTGSPSIVRSEDGPSKYWGDGAPIAGMAADHFSVRWSSTQPLSAGIYRLSVRADDGVRVLVDGVPRINEWHSATGQTYTANFSLATANHNILIEYYDETQTAFLEYSLTRIGEVVPYTAPATSTANAQATVTTAQLNVRNAPNPVTGTIAQRISRGETYPIVGRNVDSSWWQINVNGTTGWVNARFVSAANIQNVTITSNTAIVNPPSTGYTVTATGNVNLRSSPNTTSSILGVVPREQTVQILGLSSTQFVKTSV